MVLSLRFSQWFCHQNILFTVVLSLRFSQWFVTKIFYHCGSFTQVFTVVLSPKYAIHCGSVTKVFTVVLSLRFSQWFCPQGFHGFHSDSVRNLDDFLPLFGRGNIYAHIILHLNFPPLIINSPFPFFTGIFKRLREELLPAICRNRGGEL